MDRTVEGMRRELGEILEGCPFGNDAESCPINVMRSLGTDGSSLQSDKIGGESLPLILEHHWNCPRNVR